MRFTSALMGAAMIAAGQAEVFYKETFSGDWESRWIQSSHKKDSGEAGDFKLTAGEWYGDADADKGVQTSQDARFYAYSSKLDKPFSNKGKDLVVQFQVKHPQKIDCGGGYIKLHPSSLDQAGYNGDSEYNIMFGPDVCGTSTRRVHAIFNYKGTNHLIKKTVACETDQLSHVYTLVVKSDNTYEIQIDGKKKESGSLEDDWDMLKPKKIKDPEQSKPSDWVDNAMMDDPDDKKPDGWDDIPATIVDPDAEKPDDWDDEDDGEWEAPTIDNPEYKGEWKPKRIDNPDYKGPWVHPEIDNPDYAPDSELGQYDDHGAVGFEIWQVKAGTIFDNIFVGDNLAEAEAFRDETWGANKDAEKKMFDDLEKKKRDEEEAERKAREAEAEDDDDDDDDEEEEAKDEL